MTVYRQKSSQPLKWLVALIVFGPAMHKARHGACSLRDKVQIKQIHQAMLVFAGRHDDRAISPSQWRHRDR